MKVKDFVCEANWTQKALCRDEVGTPFSWPYGESICQWCLSGMILHCYPGWENHGGIFEKVKIHLKNNNLEKEGNIARWNDDPNRTWTDVRDLATTLDI